MHFFIGTVLYITTALFPGQAESPADQMIVEAYQIDDILSDPAD